jgi:predicted RNA-binding protein YlxR (DUF448 family)
MTEPIRTCIGCRKKATKGELVRLARHESGGVFVDENRKSSGRGAYVCPDPHCIDLALNPKRLNKVLRTYLVSEEIENLKRELLNFLPSLESAEFRWRNPELKDKSDESR